MSEAEKPSSPEEAATPVKPAPSSPCPVAPTGSLSKDTDKAARPGFRSPPNKGSKAQKNEKGGKKK